MLHIWILLVWDLFFAVVSNVGEGGSAEGGIVRGALLLMVLMMLLLVLLRELRPGVAPTERGLSRVLEVGIGMWWGVVFAEIGGIIKFLEKRTGAGHWRIVGESLLSRGKWEGRVVVLPVRMGVGGGMEVGHERFEIGSWFVVCRGGITGRRGAGSRRIGVSSVTVKVDRVHALLSLGVGGYLYQVCLGRYLSRQRTCKPIPMPSQVRSKGLATNSN